MTLRPMDQFDGIAKFFHWMMAILIIGMVVMGLLLEEIPRGPFKLEVMGWHKAIGMTVLGLVILRLLWRLHSPRPRPLSTHTSIEQWGAHLVQMTLYGAMFLMPISGYVVSSAAGYGFLVWGWQVPMLVPVDKEIGAIAREMHEIISNVLIGAFVLHLAGALKHHFIDRDATLSRMLPAMFIPRKKG